MRIVRVLRGIVGTASFWVALWVPVSLLPLGLAILAGNPFPSGALRAFLMAQALVGAINGLVFASVVAIAGRRRTFEGLKTSWMAACGAVGGAAGPFAVAALMLSNSSAIIPASALLETLITNAFLGAGLASLTLSVARRAPALPRDTSPHFVASSGSSVARS
jgi:hypothetical protein